MHKLILILINMLVLATMSKAALVVYQGKVVCRGVDGENKIRETINVIYIYDAEAEEGATFYYSETIGAWYESSGSSEWVIPTSDGRRDLFLGNLWNYGIDFGTRRFQFDATGVTARKQVPTGLQDPETVNVFRVLRMKGSGFFAADYEEEVWGTGKSTITLRYDRSSTFEANDPEMYDGDVDDYAQKVGADLEDQGYTVNGLPD